MPRREQPIDELVGWLQGKQWVIIDTVGTSQRDQRVIEQIAHLQAVVDRRLVLLLNAASQPETLEEVVLRWPPSGESCRCRVRRLYHHEASEVRLAPVLDIVMRHGMRVLFVAASRCQKRVATPPALIDHTVGQRFE